MKAIHFLFLTVLAANARAQEDAPTIDLTMSDNGKGQIEVRIRPDGYFNQLMSALTFTVRWPASAGIALDTAVRCYPFQDVVPMSAVQPVVNGEWMYRTFNGFSVSLLSDFDLAWYAGREYPICTADILVPGTTMELINDDWTTANNRSFFASMGGYDKTGVIYPSPEPTVAIRSEDHGTGDLDIVLTPANDFFGWVTDLDFTLRWPAGSGVSLGTAVQDVEVAEYLPIAKVGGEITAAGFTYQRFHGEGVKSIANSDDAWHAYQDVIALSLPVFGVQQGMMVVNDAWTAANEGDFLLELNSKPREGVIEGIAMQVATHPTNELNVSVLTKANGFNLLMDLPDPPKTATISLINAAGQTIWSTTRDGAHGRMSLMAETGPVCDGLYILSVRHGERSLVKRVVR